MASVSGSAVHDNPQSRPNAVLAFVIALAALLVPLLHNFNPGEFAFDADESHHAMTGFYFADFYRDLPLRHPVEYTYRYYAKFPALGLIHWPPFFHAVEGAVFDVFGGSAQSARLTVRWFVLLALFYFFRIADMLLGRTAAVATTFLLPLLPGVAHLENAVMLEWPSMAMCLGASFYWLRWLRWGEEARGGSASAVTAGRDLWCFAAFATLALLTKQQSYYLVAFCGLTLLASGDAWRWRSARLWSAVALIGALSAPFYVLAWLKHGQTISEHIAVGAPGVGGLTYYLSNMPRQSGWPLLLLAVAGTAVGLMRQRRTAVQLLLWLVACYASFGFLNARDPRYNVYSIPAIVLLAAVPLGILRSRRLHLAATALAGVIVAGYATLLWMQPAAYAHGVSTAAHTALELNSGGAPVLLDARDSGRFIFYMRALDPQRRSIVLSKALYVTNVIKQFGSLELVDNQQELAALLDEYGIRIVVVTENEPQEFPIQSVLRQYLQTPRFQLRARIPIASNQPGIAGTQLLIYENLQTQPLRARTLRLRMLTLDHDIEVPIGELGPSQ